MRRPQLIRKIAVYAVYILLITTFQVTFPGVVSIYGLYPDLMFVMVVLCAYMFGFYDGIVVGALVGLIRDYFSAPSIRSLDGSVISSVGIGLFVMIAVAALGSSFFTKRIERNFLLAFVSVVVITLLYKFVGHFVIYIWTSVLSDVTYNMDMSQALIRSILPQTALNLFASVPLYLMLKFMGPYKGGVNPVLIDEKGKGDNSWLIM
ncbi:MAG: hypothetical protein J6127_06020 [Clostridiales bacterium]|nr:hypothetical protein [Clostridiales bacterium]